MQKYLLLASALALFVTSSCSSAAKEPINATSAPRFVISLRMPAEVDHYWSVIQQSALDKATELGVELVTLNASDAAAQAKELEEAIATGVSGIAVAPIDPAGLSTVQKKADEAHIPFILIERNGNLPDVNFIGTDEEAAGRLAADYVCNPENDAMVSDYNLTARNTETAIITGAVDDPVSLARAKGGRWGLEDCLSKVVAEESANNDQALAMNVATEMIGKHANLKVILVTDDQMALGAAEAIKAAGKTGEIFVIGFGATPKVLEAVIRGDMMATIAMNPQLIGSRSIESLYMLLNEEDIPANYDTGTRLITIQNAAQFR